MAIPSILVVVVAFVLAAYMFVTYRVRVAKMYEKIVDDLYKAHTKNGEVPVSHDEFEKIMDEYKGEEVFQTDKPLKKSQKRRKEKQENEK